MTSLKEFTEYFDDVFFKEIKDVNGIKNAIDMFFDFYARNNIIDDNIINILQSIEKKIKSELIIGDKIIKNECFIGLMVGTFLGMVLEKFSKKVELKDYKL